jgi:hypothetical protein
MARKPKVELIDEEPIDEELVIRKQLIGEYVVVLSDPYMLWKIVPALQGQHTPQELRGMFTSEGRAKRAIETYKGR